METGSSFSLRLIGRFQKPTFEWVWKLIKVDSKKNITDAFQKPTFEWVWKLDSIKSRHRRIQVSEAHI